MCEILTTSGNKRGHCFPAEAYRRARELNPDGAGYILLEREKSGKRWELKEIETFDKKPESWRYSIADDLPGDWYDKGYKFDNFRRGGYATEYKPEPDIVPGEFYDKNAELKPGQLLIAHFRMATSGGVRKENTHPIIVGDYCVIHNGVFGYKKLKPEVSDTRHFAERLQFESKKHKTLHWTREQKIIDKLLKEAGGYYSIFIYSWRTGLLYYYKNGASFQYDASGLLGSTRAERFPVVVRDARTRAIIA